MELEFGQLYKKEKCSMTKAAIEKKMRWNPSLFQSQPGLLPFRPCSKAFSASWPERTAGMNAVFLDVHEWHVCQSEVTLEVRVSHHHEWDSLLEMMVSLQLSWMGLISYNGYVYLYYCDHHQYRYIMWNFRLCIFRSNCPNLPTRPLTRLISETATNPTTLC